MVHDAHDSILVPPFRILNAVDFATHDNNLTGRYQFASVVSGAQMLRNTRRLNIAIERLGQTGNHLVPLSRRQDAGRARGHDKVAVQVNNQSVRRSSEQAAAFSADTKNVWAGFFNEVLHVASVHNRDIETTPFVDTNAVADRLGGDGQDSWVVTDEDDATSGRHGSLNNTNDIRDRQTAEQWPHGKVLEAGGR